MRKLDRETRRHEGIDLKRLARDRRPIRIGLERDGPDAQRRSGGERDGDMQRIPRRPGRDRVLVNTPIVTGDDDMQRQIGWARRIRPGSAP